MHSKNKTIEFLKDLRTLLDKHGAKLYTTCCELYIDSMGFIGMLEDNIESIEVVDGNDILYSSKEKE
mgnify:CR=1 FL=1|tara:strand:+ start:276 stop:476 length:201 start_codon:yes stop_codon:yes gene_type:complete